MTQQPENPGQPGGTGDPAATGGSPVISFHAASTALKSGDGTGGAGSPVRRRRRWLRLLLGLGGFLLLSLLVSWASLRLYYSDEKLRTLAEQAVSEALGVKCHFGALTIYTADLSADFSDVTIENPDFAPNPEIAKIDKLRFDFAFLRSLTDFGLRGDLLVDGLSVKISRRRLPDKGNDDEDRYTTNVHALIRNLLGMPWKSWLDQVDWRLAGGSIRIERGQIELNDLAGALGPCLVRDLQLTLTRDSAGVETALTFSSAAPESTPGRFSLRAATRLNAPSGNPGELLSFLSDVGIESDFASLDLPYILRYYGIGRKAGKGWLPGAALDGHLKITAPKMSAATLNCEISTPELLKIFADGKPLPGAPATRLNVDGLFDFSQAMTALKPVTVRLAMSTQTPQAGAPAASGAARSADWLRINAEARGSLTEGFTLKVVNFFDSALFGESSLGRVSHFDQTAAGQIMSSLTARLEPDLRCRFRAEATAADLVFRTAAGDAAAPLEVALSGEYAADTNLLPRTGTIEIAISSGASGIKSVQPLVFALEKGTAAGMLTVRADLGEISRNFARPLAALGLGQLAEKVEGTIALQPDETWEWNLVFRQPGTDPAPLALQGKGRYAADGAFSLDTALVQQAASGGLSFNLKGGGKAAADLFELRFEEQLAAGMDSLHQLLRRFSGLLPGLNIAPQQQLAGTVRESARGNYIYKDGRFALAVALSGLAENLSFQVGSQRWQEKQTSFASAFTADDRAGSLRFRLHSFDLRSGVGNVRASTGLVDLAHLQRGADAVLANIPQFAVDANLTQAAFQRLDAALGESLPAFLRQGQSLQLQASSPGGGGVLEVKSCRFASRSLGANFAPFTLDLGKFRQHLSRKEYTGAFAAFSPLSAALLCGPEFWAAIPALPPALLRGTLQLAASYSPAEDRLFVQKLEFAAQKEDAALFNALQASADIANFTTLFTSPDLPTVLRCLKKGLNIPRADLSVPVLQALLDTGHSANLRALQGKTASLREVLLAPGREAGEFQLSARATLDLAYYSADARWPLLALAGPLAITRAQPVTLKIAPGSLRLDGALDLTGAEVRCNALNPVQYAKPRRVPARLNFQLLQEDNGKVSVPAAALTGGPLTVKLAGLNFVKLDRGLFVFKLDNLTVGAPFNLTVSNLLLDKPADRLRVQAATSGINLAELNDHLALSDGLRVAGSLGASEAQIDDRYRSFLGGRAAESGALGNNNRLKLGALELNLYAPREGGTARLGVALAAGEADTASGALTLQGLQLKKPEGFHYDPPMVIRELVIRPDTRTIFSDSLVLEELRVRGLDATIEVALKETNIEQLRKTAERLFPASKAKDESKRKTLIRDFYLEKSTVKLTQTLLQGKAAVPVPLADLHLKNLGGDAPGSAFGMILDLLLQSVGNTGAGLLKGLGGAVGGVVGGVVSGAADVVGGAAGGATDVGKALGQVLSAPFGGKKNDAPTTEEKKPAK